MTHVTYRLTAKNWEELQNPTLGNRVWATFCVLKYLATILEQLSQHPADRFFLQNFQGW